MAPEIKTKKRKASGRSDEVDQVKKVKQMTSELQSKKRKATEDATPSTVKKSKVPKSFSESENAGTVREISSSNSAAPKGETFNISMGVESVTALKTKKDNKDKKSKKSKHETVESKPDELSAQNDDSEDVANESEEEEIDDQTEALLKGFENDEDDSDDDDPEVDFTQPNPALTKLEKRIKKKVDKAAEKKELNSEKPGVLYIGRVPHGFYENEMRQYFKQFGDITRLRLSRNRKTGQSKHFAFIEFKSADVAEIVAKTMDNYLLFNHVLKCKIVPPEQVHQDLWKGANKRFKKVPWNKIEGRKLAQPKTVDEWEMRIEREEKRRAEKAEKLKGMGYEFASPKLKSPQDIVKYNTEKYLLAKASETPMEAMEAAKTNEEPITNDKKKSKKLNADKSEARKAIEAPEEAEEEMLLVEAEKPRKKKEKKQKKVGESVAANGADEPVLEEASNEPHFQTDLPSAVEKTKKSKKEKKKGKTAA